MSEQENTLPIDENHVIAERPLQRRADSEQSRIRLLIHGVGLEFDPVRAEGLEGMRQLQ